MTMLNFTTNPPTFRINEYSKKEDFDLLRMIDESGEGENKEYIYSIPELRKLTLNLMHYLSIPYDSRYPDETVKMRLEDFTDEEKRLYYPFAFILACLDSNAFRTGQINAILQDGDKIDPVEGTIKYYIPDAYQIIKANTGNLDEVRGLILDAAGKTDFDDITKAPENRRLLIYGKMPEGHDEMGMAWKDRMDGRWYFAPQGGLVPFIPTKWAYVPEPNKDTHK